MPARVDELCDLARDVIQAAALSNPLAGTAVSVECVDDPDVDTDAMPAGEMKVFVCWAEYSDDGPASRRGNATDYQIVVIAVEVCGEAGKVPTDWRRLRTEWVDKCVVKVLGDARARLGGAFALRLDAVTYDLEELTERHAFWSGVAITLREVC